MNKKALVLAAVVFGFVNCDHRCFAQQSLHNQSGDDLLKGFDVDPEYLKKFPAMKNQGSQTPSSQTPSSQIIGPAGAPQVSPPQSYPQGNGTLNMNGSFNFNGSASGGTPLTGDNVRGFLHRLIDGAIPSITKTRDGRVEVKAPFVNVNVGGNGDGVQVTAPFVNVGAKGEGSVNVRAPFVNVGKGTDDNVSVSAPFTEVGKSGKSGKGGDSNVSVSAPFTNVGRSGDSNVSVSAPFTKVNKKPDSGVSVSAPLTNVNNDSTSGSSAP